jgi:O-antigen/teichoic acid export membrane protein
VAVTFADQVVSSTSNFITGVAIARFSGAGEFGEYALVLTVWLIAVGVHRRVITEPIIVVTGDADTGASAIAHGVGAEVVLGLGASAITAACGLVGVALGADIGLMLLALSPWFVPLLLQDYWRAIAYQRRRPGLALVNDLAFAAAQVAVIALFAWIGWRSGAHMITAWGIGAAVGAGIGFRWFPSRARWIDGCRLLVRLWPQGRWLLADFLTAFASQQGYLVFAALLLSRIEYGGFRAGFSLMGPTVVILLAAGNVGLPEAARRADVGDRTALERYVRQLTTLTLCAVATYGLALAFLARPLLRALYGPPFERFSPLVLLAALQYVIIVSMYGQGIALRATEGMTRLWKARVVVAVASFAALLVLWDRFGLNGVGWAGVATAACEALSIYWIYRRMLWGRTGVAPPSSRSVVTPRGQPVAPPDQPAP